MIMMQYNKNNGQVIVRKLDMNSTQGLDPDPIRIQNTRIQLLLLII